MIAGHSRTLRDVDPLPPAIRNGRRVGTTAKCHATLPIPLTKYHHAGTVHISAAWFSLHGVGGKGSLVAGFLITVFMFSGWDGTIYVNEEVRHRRVNPGRAAMIAVAVAGVLFILAQIGLQGVVSYKKLNNNSTSVLVYLGHLLSGSSIGGSVIAFALALSVVAATGVGIMLSARIAYGIASHRALPGPLANVSPRFSTPVIATVVAGGLLLILSWVYLFTTSVQNAFGYVLNNTGILYATFYCVTALAAMVYFRRRVLSNWLDALTLGILPICAIAFLGWISSCCGHRSSRSSENVGVPSKRPIARLELDKRRKGASDGGTGRQAVGGDSAGLRFQHRP